MIVDVALRRSEDDKKKLKKLLTSESEGVILRKLSLKWDNVEERRNYVSR